MGKVNFNASEVWPKEVLPVTHSKPDPAPKASPVKVSSVKATPVKATAKPSAPAELWRNSSVHPELMVSNQGRVKAREYQLVTQDKDGKYRIYNVPAKMLDNKIGSSGDVIVSFTNSSGNIDTESVAYLVAMEFVPNEDAQHFTKVKFRDLDKTNLRAVNLWWDGSGLYKK